MNIYLHRKTICHLNNLIKHHGEAVSRVYDIAVQTYVLFNLLDVCILKIMILYSEILQCKTTMIIGRPLMGDYFNRNAAPHFYTFVLYIINSLDVLINY